MAHMISEVSGRAEAYFAGKRAWHGLGTVVKEAVTSADAIKIAGLDWEVDQQPVWISPRIPGGKSIKIPDRKANVRWTEDGSPIYLGTVGNHYKPIQNQEAFGFVDDLLGGGDIRLESAGALRKGKRIWILARTPQDIELRGVNGKKDTILPYFLFFNGHDGVCGCKGLFTGVRVVCQNTLNMALGRDGHGAFSIRHIGKVRDKLEEAKRVLGIITHRVEKATEQWNFLLSAKAEKIAVKAYFRDVFPMPKDPSDRQVENRKRILVELEESFEAGPGAELGRGRWWGAYNAVTHRVDHMMNPNVTDRRFENIVMGQGSRIKAQALQLATLEAAK